MKINEYNQMMKYLTRPKESEYEQVAMAGPFIKGGKKAIDKLIKKGKVKKGEAPKTNLKKVRARVQKDREALLELAKNEQIPVEQIDKLLSGEIAQVKRTAGRGVIKLDKDGNPYVTETFTAKIDPSTLSTEDLIEFRKTNRAGKGQFTNAEAIIARLENTIKEVKPDDEDYEYVSQTFPNFIKELKAKPELANNENVWNNLMSDLPENQRFVKYDDGTVDFQTKKTTHTFKLREDLDTDRTGPIAPDDDPGMFDDIFNKMYPDYSEGGKYEMPLPGEEPLTKKKRTLNAEGGVIGGGMIEGDDLGSRTGFAEPLPAYVQEYLKETFPDLNLEFTPSSRYGLSRQKDKALYQKVYQVALDKLKNKDYVYTPVGTDFESLEYKKGYGTGKQLIAKAKEKGIYVSDSTLASIFADNFKIPSEQNPKKRGRDKIYDLSVLDDDAFVEKIQRAQVSAGRATPEATEKFLSKDIKKAKKRKTQSIREAAEKSKGGVKDAFKGTRISGVEKGHMNDLFSQYITGQNLGYVPKDINKEIGKKGGIDDKMRSLYKKRERLLKQKPKNLKKELENINAKGARLAGQSQGFKTFTIMDPVSEKTYEFGGSRFQIDPTNQFPGMTESEIVDFIKNADPNDFDAQLKIKIFEDNRKAVFDAVKKQQKPLTKSFIEKQKSDRRFFNPKQLNSGFAFLDNIITPVMEDVASGAVKYGPDVLRGVGKFGLSEALLGLPGAPFDVAEGRSKNEVLLNIATLGAGVPIKDELERNKFLESFSSGLSKDYQMAKTKQAIASGQARGYEQMNPEFSVLTDREQLALDKADEWTTTVLQPRLQEGIKSFQEYQKGFEESESDFGLGLYALGGRVEMNTGGDPKDKKKTTPALDKPTIQIDPNAPTDPAKRDTLKGAGILGAGVVAGKLGLLEFGPKAIKTVKKVTSDLKEQGMPDFFYEIVEAVKRFGKKEKYKTGILNEDDVYTYRNPKTKEFVTVEEGPEEVRIEFSSDTGNPSTIGVRKGIPDESTKGKTPPDEYFEQSQIRYPQHGEDYKDIVDEVAGGYDDLPKIVEDIIDID